MHPVLKILFSFYLKCFEYINNKFKRFLKRVFKNEILQNKGKSYTSSQKKDRKQVVVEYSSETEFDQKKNWNPHVITSKKIS